MISWSFILPAFPKRWISKINVRDSFFIFNWSMNRSISNSISLHPRWELLKLHHILSQCSCFIWEDIANLSQFFIQITWLSLCGHILGLVKHGHIIFNQHTLKEFDHFLRDQKRTRHKVHHGQKPCAKENQNGIIPICMIKWIELIWWRSTKVILVGRQEVFLTNISLIPKLIPKCAKNSSDETQHRLHTNPKDDKSIGRLFYFAKFRLALRWIHHNFGLMACKYSRAIYPIRISQWATSHAHVVDIQA